MCPRMPASISDLDASTLFNSVEAGWWFLMAVLVLAAGRRFRGTTFRLRLVLALFFALFGLSDVIEVQTGAWWRPLGLLILKGVCVAGLLACSAIVFRNRKHRNSPAARV